jgi:hypothetical protein
MFCLMTFRLEKRYAYLESLSSESFKYWSKNWGIYRNSHLCNISNFDLFTDLMQDPMHLLLEEVVPYEVKLLLNYCIC